MRSVVQYLQYVNLVLFTVVAVVAVRQWRRHRARAGLWAALSFIVLAAVVDAAPLIPEEREALWAEVAVRLLLAALVLFPFFLYRFAVTFRPPTRRVALLVGALTAVMLVWTLALPDVPAEEDAWTSGFRLYLLGLVLHWTLLTVVVTYTLWTAGRGESSVARKRMRLLALAAATITLTLIIAASADDDNVRVDALSEFLSTVSALAFLTGLKPPPLLRIAWRRPEQERLQAAITNLMGATSAQEVVDRVLPPMAEIVGATRVELRDGAGKALGTYGDEDVATQNVRIDVEGGGELRLWTSAYAPFFGSEEMRLLRSLASLTALALDRTRLFAQEREARVALERADEIKMNFVALAAHELRTPAATVHGLVETIHVRRDELTPSQLRELENALRDQTSRLRQLVDQLLDMSRLDADAVQIQPERVRIRERVADLVGLTAAERAAEVNVQVPRDLEATVDPGAFDRIVSNLIVNALRYGDPPVTVSAQRTDRHFRLVVEDRGSGVSPDFVPSLFDRFTRSPRAAQRASGTGLGLAIAQSYARAHNGDLIYEQADPHGARFQFVLPVRERAPAPECGREDSNLQGVP